MAMNQQLEQLKSKALNTHYPKWRNILSTLYLVSLPTVTVLTFLYIYLFYDNTSCLKGTVYLSVPWLVAQLVVAGYLFLATNVPAVARGSIELVVGFGNMWFILYLFGRSCS